MGILSNLKNMIIGDKQDLTNENCLIISSLSKAEYKLASIIYYKGHTSYRSFYKFVYFNNMTKLLKLFDDAESKATRGCTIEQTFVRFIYNDRMYIDIPFNIFSEKKDMPSNIRDIESWHKTNITRMILVDPQLKKLDAKLIYERFMAVVMEYLEE